MKKLAIITTAILLVSILFKYGTEAYVNRPAVYPDGPTMNGEDLFVDPFTGVFYKSARLSKDNVFSGILVRYHPNGNILAKGGVKDGKLHGQFDCWYENGQKQASLVWKNASEFTNLKAYYPSGKRIKGDAGEIASRIFSGEIITE